HRVNEAKSMPPSSSNQSVLDEIANFKKRHLKKTVTNDRSAPILTNIEPINVKRSSIDKGYTQPAHNSGSGLSSSTVGVTSTNPYEAGLQHRVPSRGKTTEQKPASSTSRNTGTSLPAQMSTTERKKTRL
ncbi:unnamed protein product, partial [Didymodactylos carnosus]